MKVYLHGGGTKLPVENHTLICAPAGHLPATECAEDWWEASGGELVPKQFHLIFHYGQCEVPDDLGRYLVKTGQCEPSRLVIPNAWNY